MNTKPHTCSIAFFFQVYSGMDYESCATETFYGPEDGDKAIADAKAYAAKGREETRDDWVAVFRCAIGGTHGDAPKKVEIFHAKIQDLVQEPTCTECHRGNPISSLPRVVRHTFATEHQGYCTGCLAASVQIALEALRKTDEDKAEILSIDKQRESYLTCDCCGFVDPYMAPELAGEACRQKVAQGHCSGVMRDPKTEKELEAGNREELIASKGERFVESSINPRH